MWNCGICGFKWSLISQEKKTQKNLFLLNKQTKKKNTIFQVEICTWVRISFLENFSFEIISSVAIGFLLIGHTFAPP